MCLWNSKLHIQINLQALIEKRFHIKLNKHLQFIDVTLNTKNMDLVIKYTFGLHLTNTKRPLGMSVGLRRTDILQMQ